MCYILSEDGSSPKHVGGKLENKRYVIQKCAFSWFSFLILISTHGNEQYKTLKSALIFVIP
jgi:hypothetical protein